MLFASGKPTNTAPPKRIYIDQKALSEGTIHEKKDEAVGPASFGDAKESGGGGGGGGGGRWLVSSGDIARTKTSDDPNQHVLSEGNERQRRVVPNFVVLLPKLSGVVCLC